MKPIVKDIEKSKTRFINKAICKYGDRYDYTLVNYINSITKVEIICKIHGTFWLRPDAHITKVGCPKCNGGGKDTQDEFIRKAIIKHDNKYDYSLVRYINSATKIEIICKIHGIFLISPVNHLVGNNCAKCSNRERKTTDIFIEQAIDIHGSKYDYSLVNYINNRINVKIICKKHNVFSQCPKDHLKGHGCKYCSTSVGEKLISESLIKLNIEYNTQYTFKDCKGVSGGSLPFDFYLPKHNMCIEYDGRQHYEPVTQFGGQIEFEKLKQNDLKRNNYCLDKNIKLFRIKYNDISNDLESFVTLISNLLNRY